MKWEKKNILYFLFGCFVGGGAIFEGIGKFMEMPLGYLLGLILWACAIIVYLLIFKIEKK